MNFDELYKNSKHIIYFLLKKYNIKYNNDEYIQLLTIKMWELSKVYTPQKSSLNSFLYHRLNFFIIDLFRSQHIIETYNIFELDNLPNNNAPFDDARLLYDNFRSHLSEKEQLWLQLKLAGYKQKELAKALHCSISTLKNYQKRVKIKYKNYYLNK
ncbi:sigma-70 family RNA polymerase sigma factor [Staphylococcus pseudoxylosus]|uniref:sigma-70 family RNA polymerase sigma factor n=1 Tax=Staphylococcus pseudoxylosus TaxID=2282419 RepID=UPI001BDA85E7|nr:sigma-70 family RNA polymerase sigma factor [Staphylococcus pseudoxylosus]